MFIVARVRLWGLLLQSPACWTLVDNIADTGGAAGSEGDGLGIGQVADGQGMGAGSLAAFCRGYALWDDDLGDQDFG